MKPNVPSIGDVRQRQRDVLDRARPIDRRMYPDRWTAGDFATMSRTAMLASFWGSDVPGSGAYDEMLTGAVVAADQLGWDVDAALPVLGEGWELVAVGSGEALLANAADRLFDALERGRISTPTKIALKGSSIEPAGNVRHLDARMLASWQGKIAGGSFGTALEGCRGRAIGSVYGDVRGYVTAPNTLNDDVVYELVALSLLESGAAASTDSYAHQWSARIPFGWSAEWVALDNLARGLSVSDAAIVRNPFTEWIGAQMRSTVFGQLCPGRPLAAAAMARTEAVVSHRGGGVAGAAFAAMLAALAFVCDNACDVVVAAAELLPPSPYRDEVVRVIDSCQTASAFDDVWPDFEDRHRDKNWIHGVPNIGAVIASLWFGGGDMTESFALLARAGLDVDCNAGLVGTVLGAMNAVVPTSWLDPLQDRIDTYLPSLPSIPISVVAEQTLRLSQRMKCAEGSEVRVTTWLLRG